MTLRMSYFVMKPSVIVWDLKTVPDLGGFTAANDLVGNADADIRAVLGNKFPKHIYHTIVCIGALRCIFRFAGSAPGNVNGRVRCRTP
jgi:hypothetical protein